MARRSRYSSDGFRSPRAWNSFDQAMGDVALAAQDAAHVSVGIEFDDRLGQIEVDRAAREAAAIEQQGQLLHPAEFVRQRGVALVHLRIAFQRLIDVGIGHALGRTDHSRRKLGTHPDGPTGVYFQNRAHHRAIERRGLSEQMPLESSSGSMGTARLGKYTEALPRRRRAFAVQRRAAGRNRATSAMCTCNSKCPLRARAETCTASSKSRAVSPSMVTMGIWRKSRRPRRSSSSTFCGAACAADDYLG